MKVRKYTWFSPIYIVLKVAAAIVNGLMTTNGGTIYSGKREGFSNQ